MASFTRASDSRLAERHYDMIVVGGGINGVAIVRDAATRGLRVALVERGDLAIGTSSWNSRLIHGGLRYLEHGEVPLVYESLHDRESLLRIAPHLVQPLEFVMPLYRHNHLPGWMFRAGVLLYDILSARKSVPWHRGFGRAGVSRRFPALATAGLSGAVQYYDGQVELPERLVVETALSAHQSGADIATYVEATKIRSESGRTTGVEVRDTLTGEVGSITSDCVVSAAGPWVDVLGATAQRTRQIGGTTGTHLIVDPFPGAPDACVYFEARSDSRPILLMPWNGRYLLGTTDDIFDGDASEVRGTDSEVAYLLSEVSSLIPRANLVADDVLLTYTGVRPLPYRPGVKAGKIPRSHLIVRDDDLHGLVTIVGGKLTPHLSLGKQTVDVVGKVLGKRLPPSSAATRPLPGAYAASWRERDAAADNLRGSVPWNEPISTRLVKVYGAAVTDILTLAASDESLNATIGSGRGAVVVAEVHHAIVSEGALTLVDLLHRRTMVGLEPAMATDVDREVAAIAAPLLNWNDERVEAEITAHRRYIQRLQGGLTRADATSGHEHA